MIYGNDKDIGLILQAVEEKQKSLTYQAKNSYCYSSGSNYIFAMDYFFVAMKMRMAMRNGHNSSSKIFTERSVTFFTQWNYRGHLGEEKTLNKLREWFY